MESVMSIVKKLSPDAREVGKELLKIGAVDINVNSPFTWVSGIKSPIYCDNRKIVSNVDVRRAIVDYFVSFIEDEFPNVDTIAGVATGGIPLGVLIAEKMGLPFIYVRSERKKHGLKKQVEGVYNKGDKVVLIEDHVSTGGSSIKAIDGIREEELDLLGLVSIMTYGFGIANYHFEENDVNNYSLCDLDTIVDVSCDLGTISQEEKESVLRFRENPNEWM